MTKCEICLAGIDAGPLYRMNKPGEMPPRWRHITCGARPDPDLRVLAECIDEADATSLSSAAAPVDLPEEQPVLGEERWRAIALHLYAQLDNIDTLYDACKGNEHAFYVNAAKYHTKRHEVARTDGYRVIFLRDRTAVR